MWARGTSGASAVSVPEGLPENLVDRLEDFEKFIDGEMERTGSEAAGAGPQADTIWHYTDVKGALGILESGRFWFTERAHLNDPSEVKHGLDLAVGIVEELAREASSQLRNVSARFLRDGLDRTLGTFGFYVGSFSFDSDDLGQWRAYADEGRGVALGFSSTAFDNPSPESGIETPHTFTVRYDGSVLKEYQRRAVNRALNLLEEPELQDEISKHHETAVARIFTTLALLLIWNSVMFKHPAYEHEKEFRVLHLGERKDFEIRSFHRRRERQGEIVDFLDLPIPPGLSSPDVLTHLRIGPAAPDELIAQLREATRSLGIAETLIDKSGIPFRAVG